MNKITPILGLTMVLSMLSCSQDEFPQMELVKNHVTATITDAAASRTAMGDGGKVLWLAGDDISLVLKSGWHSRYVVSGAVNSNSTTFSPDLSTEEYNWNATLSGNFGIYPYNSNYSVTVSDNSEILHVDANWENQLYVEGTFEDDKAIMTAKSSSRTFSFTNAFSLLNIQLKAEVSGSYSVSSISVSSNSWPLNGTATIDMSIDKPALVCTGSTDFSKTNTLSISEPVILTKNPTNFYLLVPARTYEANDLTIHVTGKNLMDDIDLDWSCTMSNPVPCYRSKVTTLTHTFKAVDFSGSTEGDIN